MIRSIAAALAAAATLLAFAPVHGAAGIELAAANPDQGEPVIVTLTGPGDAEPYELVAVYRPGSRTEKREVVGLIGRGRTVSWVPLHAEITRLAVVDAEGGEIAGRNVAVRFASPPATGLIIFFLAGLLLFGGASYAMRRALEGGRPPAS